MSLRTRKVQPLHCSSCPSQTRNAFMHFTSYIARHLCYRVNRRSRHWRTRPQIAFFTYSVRYCVIVQLGSRRIGTFQTGYNREMSKTF